MLSEEAKQSLDNIIGRNTENLNEIATSVTYKFFETLPIYNLNDAGLKGSVASLALKEVRFNEDAAVITLSPAQAIIKILSFIGAILLIAWTFLGFYIPRRKNNDVRRLQANLPPKPTPDYAQMWDERYRPDQG